MYFYFRIIIVIIVSYGSERPERATLYLLVLFSFVIHHCIRYTRMKFYFDVIGCTACVSIIITNIICILVTMRGIVVSCKISNALIPRDTKKERERETSQPPRTSGASKEGSETSEPSPGRRGRPGSTRARPGARGKP